MFFADSDNTSQEEEPADRRQRGAKIDHHEVHAGCCSFAYTAVIGPGCAINGDGKGVNIWSACDAPPCLFAAMGIPGNQEDKQGIKNGYYGCLYKATIQGLVVSDTNRDGL